MLAPLVKLGNYVSPPEHIFTYYKDGRCWVGASDGQVFWTDDYETWHEVILHVPDDTLWYSHQSGLSWSLEELT